MRRYKSTNFSSWWRGLKKHSRSKRRTLITQWLKLAAVTVALRGDQDQQRVVYAIRKRDMNSKYPLSKTNARRVFDIVNAKMNMYKNQTYKQKPKQDKTYPEVKIIRRRTTKTIARADARR